MTAVGLTLAGSVGCGTAGGGDRQALGDRNAATAPPASPPPSSDRGAIRRAGRLERAHFALLRTRPEPLGPSIRRILRRPTDGMGWDLAQRLALPTLEAAYWLIPGRRVLCLLQTDGAHAASSTCAPTRVALEHGIVAVSVRETAPAAPARRLIVGVAPDGARRVVLRTGAQRTSVPVVRHLFAVEDAASEAPDRVTLR